MNIGSLLGLLVLSSPVWAQHATAPRSEVLRGSAEAQTAMHVAPVTVEDLARYAALGDPHSLDWNEQSTNQVAVLSPDGEQMAVVVRRGDLSQRMNEATLLVYRTAEIFDETPPRSLVTLVSATNYQPIAYVRWFDNYTLVFAGTEHDQRSQVYRVSVHDGKMRALTNESAQIVWYDVAPAAGRLVTLRALPERSPAEDPLCRSRGCLVTAETYYAAQHGRSTGSAVLSVHDLRTNVTRDIPNPEDIDDTFERCDDELIGGISPDGRFGLRTCTIRQWPAWWADYTSEPSLSFCLQQRNTRCARRVVLIDLDNGTTSTVSDAPVLPWNTKATWINGGREVVLAGTGVFQSLSDADTRERARRARAPAVVLFSTTTHRTTSIAQLDSAVQHVPAVSWDRRSATLTLEARGASGVHLPAISYVRKHTRWSKKSGLGSATEPAGDRPHLVVEQSLNDRPVLVAIDRQTGRRKQVLDPNPWLAERQLGHVEQIEWTSKRGHLSRGGLYYPRNFERGKRYPLVIQTHGFSSEQFSLYGIARNFVAQPLASQDIAVLQIQENYAGAIATLDEWLNLQACYEAAIDHLADVGIIDRTRVGIQGWSRTGPSVGYTLTHSAYPFAAAAFTSSGDFGWWYYIAGGASASYDTFYGAAPFGSGLQAWFTHAPTFNLDRVHTPMFMWGNTDVYGLWDWYAGLRRLGKPVEYWYLPDGTHDVFQVGQRIHTGQLLVDWFRFWLKDEEDNSSEKREQYLRWRQLRVQQNAASGEPRHSPE